MPELVAYLLLFLVVGVGFILVHLLVGKLIRPARPHDEKLTIYECGEPTIGSAWVQFDVRFYVVALLFVIFDVEVAFFFPWAVVFGKAAELGSAQTSVERRLELSVGQTGGDTTPLVAPFPETAEARSRFRSSLEKQPPDAAAVASNREAARQLAGIAFVDILVFFGVLLVGFAYLWRRGDLQWVRSLVAESSTPEATAQEPAGLVGAGTGA
jgi:NADH-quinone oxidoreductase subunit A